MKILFVGIFSNSWSTSHAMKNSFQRLGHQVSALDYRSLNKNYQKKKIKIIYPLLCFIYHIAPALVYRVYSLFPSLVHKLYYKAGNIKQINQKLFEETRKGNYDLVFFAKADTIDYKLIPEINKYAKTWYYFMDSLKMAKTINAKEYALRCTYVSSTSSTVDKFFKSYGANSMHLTQGVDTRIFFPKKERKIYNIIFVGTAVKRRKKIISHLRKNKIEIKCFGAGWENPPIYRKNLANLYRKTKIILNLNTLDPKYQNSAFSIRIFQAIGTGSFLLSEYSRDLGKIFKKRVHLDWFRHPQECVNLINFYLKNEKLREQFATKGYQHVKEKYSWEKVIKNIAQIVNLNL